MALKNCKGVWINSFPTPKKTCLIVRDSGCGVANIDMLIHRTKVATRIYGKMLRRKNKVTGVQTNKEQP